MSRPIDTTQGPQRSDDALLNRYLEANARDPLRPNPSLREAVLTHAKTHQSTAQAVGSPRAAANDSHWKIRALGSLAVMGLVGLLAMQFERGSPEEQSAALGAAPMREQVATAPSAAAVAVPAPTADTDEKALKATEPPPPRLAPAIERAQAPAGMKRSAEQGPTSTVDTAATASEALAALADSAAPAHGPTTAAETVQRPATVAAAAPFPAIKAPNIAAPPMHKATPPSFRAADAPRAEAAPMAASPPALPALHAAAMRGDTEELERLLNGPSANVNERGAQGETALMRASAGDNTAVLLALLKSGADTSLKDNAGLSAADYAKRAGRLAWLPLLQP